MLLACSIVRVRQQIYSPERLDSERLELHIRVLFMEARFAAEAYQKGTIRYKYQSRALSRIVLML